MFKLDENLLQQLGLGALPAEEKTNLLKLMYEKLEERVGMNLANQMSDAQLDEFERLMPTESDTPETIAQKEQAALSRRVGLPALAAVKGMVAPGVVRVTPLPLQRAAFWADAAGVAGEVI